MVKPNNPSRFSSLKVFNFSNQSSKSLHANDNHDHDSCTEAESPPPLPPKDRYYLYNKSMSSLLPDSYSIPSTPLSPTFGKPPLPSQSTIDLSLSEFGGGAGGNKGQRVSPLSSMSGRSTGTSGSGSSRKKGFFGKLAARNNSRNNSKAARVASPECGDEGISAPWNFQHNMHVDEGLSGLPPSWTTSLSEAGFSDEEIAQIQARKAANLSPSPSSMYLYTDRPASPVIPLTPGNNTVVIANPVPRTTSLPRQQADDASIASSVSTYRNSPSIAGSSSIRSTNSTSPRPPPLRPPGPVRQYSNPANSDHPNQFGRLVGHQHSDTVTSYSSLDTNLPEAQYVYINGRMELVRHAPDETSNYGGQSSPRSGSPASSSGSGPSVVILNGTGIQSKPFNGKRLRTPPKRTYRVVNDDLHGVDEAETEGILMSPPPAYKSPARESAFAGISSFAKTRSVTQSEPPIPTQQEESSPQSSLKLKRLTALPPRLSLHADTSDLGSWSESLFSALPSAREASGSKVLQKSPLSTSPSSTETLPSSSSPCTTAARPPTSASSLEPPLASASLHRKPPPQKAIPSIPASDEDKYATTNGGLTTPLWNEVMGMLTSAEQAEGTPPFTPALSESHSPTLPLSPWYGHQRQDEQVDEAEGNQYLEPRKRDSNRDSSMSTATVTTATIVRNASIATRAIANVIARPIQAPRRRVEEEEEDDDDDDDDEEEESLVFPPTPSPIKSTFPADDTTPRNPGRHYKTSPMVPRPLSPTLSPPAAPGSPGSSYFSESSESGSGSTGSQSSESVQHARTKRPPSLPPKSLAYLSSSPLSSPSPSPSQSTFGDQQKLVVSTMGTVGAPKGDYPRGSKSPGELEVDTNGAAMQKPSIVLNGIGIDNSSVRPEEPPDTPSSTVTSSLATPGVSKRYCGWVSEVVAPLEEFINEAVDPRKFYTDLQEIAEADSGSVYAARVTKPTSIGLPIDTSFVAIKNVPILPSGSPKLVDLRKELMLLRGLRHENVLCMDELYVDIVEDSLWIRMELMERSLADVVGLVSEGLMVQERMIARFASDVLMALEYLHKYHIAHRDVRSDNLLLNKDGVLKIADFSSAVQVTPEKPECMGEAGVIYWQAPEMRTGEPYNALKVDIWSLGATIWETAESEPPFADVQDPRQIDDRWPSLKQPEIYSRSFHDFLRLCSEPSSSRPDPSALLNTPFIRNACGRPVNVQLLSQCRAIEESMLQQENADS